jgi:hypothetical protein
MHRRYLVLLFLLCTLSAAPLLAQEPSATARDRTAHTLVKAEDGNTDAADIVFFTAGIRSAPFPRTNRAAQRVIWLTVQEVR